MIDTRGLLAVLLIGGALFSGAGRAVDSLDKDELTPLYQDKGPWQEQRAELPPLPDLDRLTELQVDPPDGLSSVRYFIDPQSLSIGERDGVIRYTVVIRPRAGVDTFYYEGARCHDRLYKTYAYASGDEPLQLMQSATWAKPQTDNVFRYRAELLDYYLCDQGSARRSVKAILREIRYPPEVYGPADM